MDSQKVPADAYEVGEKCLKAGMDIEIVSSVYAVYRYVTKRVIDVTGRFFSFFLFFVIFTAG